VDRHMTGPVVWPSGWTKLHVYVLPDLHRNHSLRRVVDEVRAVIGSHPAITPVAEEWLQRRCG
jgi:hypothetical protein